MLALLALNLLALPMHVAAASAQPAPDGCLENPVSCLPPPPPLPPTPAVDECLKDPSSCLPPLPQLDECVADPQSCLPGTEEVDRCLEDPESCVPEDVRGVLGPGESQEPGKEPDEDQEAFAGPVKGTDPPRGSKGAPSTSSREGADPATTRSQPAGASVTGLSGRSAGAVVPGPEGILDRIGGGLTDAARRFAIPLAVAALVAAFLIVQGRIDRRDPKLAAAPVDGRDDVVLFR